MRFRSAILALLCATAAWAALDMPGDEASNRRLLKLWAADPAHADRLRTNLVAFQNLPADQQDRLRKLDKSLHDLDTVERDRLRGVMERYAGWLSRLDPTERARIQAIPPGPERAKVISEILDRQWQESLPRADKERLAKAGPEEKTRLLETWRKEEKERREMRAVARRTVEEAAQFGPLGQRIDDFRDRVAVYVEDSLRPLATPAEEARISGMARMNPGRWLQSVHDVAAGKSPLPFPGPAVPGGRKAVRSFRDIPTEVATRFPAPLPRAITDAEGKWPDFPLAVMAIARQNKLDLPANLLGPTRVDELPPGAKRFVANDLLPKLSAEDKGQLAATEGQWPEYPKKVKELSDKYKLTVPGLVLPGTPEQWTAIMSSRQFRGGKGN
ncbi:MAG: hypothetical protein K1X57_12170 [Gemmataceae bacterium]|nr:hypothetical protein [Gemmataceae bacterium]